MLQTVSEPKTLQAVARIEVRFNECDPLGIVWHGNYAKYLEEGREAFGKAYGLDYMDFYYQGYATPIVNLNIDFKKTLRYRDVALVEARYIRTEAAKVIFEYTIRNGVDGEVVCKATTTQVFVASGTLQLSMVCPEVYTQWKIKAGLL